MNWAKFIWETRSILGQISLAFKQSGDVALSILTLNTQGLEERCEAGVDAFLAEQDARRP